MAVEAHAFHAEDLRSNFISDKFIKFEFYFELCVGRSFLRSVRTETKKKINNEKLDF